MWLRAWDRVAQEHPEEMHKFEDLTTREMFLEEMLVFIEYLRPHEGTKEYSRDSFRGSITSLVGFNSFWLLS